MGRTLTAPESTSTNSGRPPVRRDAPRVTRREFLRRSWLISWAGVLASFAGASIAFLWPSLRGGFGARLDVGSAEDILETIRSKREPFAFPSGRLYVVEYDASLDPDGQYAELTGGAPLMALYHRCPHLGCRVPWCTTSQWFECPCHGSRYNRWGEYQFGPAPRGMDRFALTVDGNIVTVDTSRIITGPTRTSAVLKQPPEGPHCT